MSLETKPDTGNRKPESKESANGSNGNTPPPAVQEIALEEILRSPFNRTIETKKSPEFDELVDSIRQHGVIQPGLARPLHLDAGAKPGTPRVELVIGERRWLGSQAAGRKTMPLLVRQLTDLEAIELQTIENDKRQDLSPIEEAEKYQQLIDQYVKAGATQEKAMTQLCEKLSKGKSTVYEALRLLKLPAAAKAAVKEGKLPPSHAGLVLKLEKFPEAQKDALAQILKPDRDDDIEEGQSVLSFRATKELVDEVEAVAKARLNWATRVEAHYKAGGAFLSEELCKQVMPYAHNYVDEQSGYVEADDYCDEYGDDYGKLMGKKAPKPILVHSTSYRIAEVYKKTDALAAIKANGKKPQARSGGAMGSLNAAARKAAAATRKKTMERRAIVDAVVKRAAGGNGRWTLELFKFIVRGMRQRILSDSAREMFNRRGLQRKDFKTAGYQSPHYVWLDREIDGIKAAPQAVGLIVDMALAMDLSNWSGQPGSGAKLLDQACKIFGVDAKAVIVKASDPKKESGSAVLKWTRPPEGDFKFNSSGVCEKPATLILPFPKSSKITVHLHVARVKQGYTTASELQVSDAGAGGLPSSGLGRPTDVFKTVREALLHEARYAAKFLKEHKALKRFQVVIQSFIEQIKTMHIDEGRGLCVTTPKKKVQTSGPAAAKAKAGKTSKAKKKGGLTAAAAKKLGEAMKARWAARRKAAKK